MLHHIKMGSVVKRCVHQLPLLDLEATIQPITRTVLRVRLVITPMFKWDDKVIFNRSFYLLKGISLLQVESFCRHYIVSVLKVFFAEN